MSKRLVSKRPVSSEKTRTQSLLALTKKPEDWGQDCRTHSTRSYRLSHTMNIFKLSQKNCLTFVEKRQVFSCKKNIFTTGYFNINQNT